MDTGEATYTPAREAGRQLPPALMQYLDGRDLPRKTQALRLCTVDGDGWPRETLLSAGEMLAMSPQQLRFALFAQSTTAANLARDARVTLTVVLDDGLCQVRLAVRRLSPDDGPLAAYEGTVDAVRLQSATYAGLDSGLVFRLHEPEAVLPRWQQQLAALRRAG